MVSRTATLAGGNPQTSPRSTGDASNSAIKTTSTHHPHLASTPMPSSTSSLLTEPLTTCLGLDIAKAKFDACLLHAGRTHQAHFENSPAGLVDLRTWCHKHGAPTPFTVLEATGRYSELAASTLHTAGHIVHLANPRRIKHHGQSL